MQVFSLLLVLFFIQNVFQSYLKTIWHFYREHLYLSVTSKCQSCLCSCRAFHFELACTNVQVGLEHKVRFIAGYCAQCEDLLKLELFLEERRVQRWRIMRKLVRGCALHPRYRLLSSFLSFLCLFMSRLSVQFLLCSFTWDWRGGFSLSKAVLFCCRALACLFWIAKIKWTVPPCLCSVSRGPSLPWLPAVGTLSAGQ